RRSLRGRPPAAPRSRRLQPARFLAYRGKPWSPGGRPATPPEFSLSIAAHPASSRSLVVAALGLAALGFVTLSGTACTKSQGAETSAASRAARAPASAPAGGSLTADRIRVRTEKPARDVIASYLETTSHVEAIADADVFVRGSGFDRSAPVREIRVEEGDRVKAGQILAVLDQVEARNALDQSEILFKESERAVEDAKLALDESNQRVTLATADADQSKRDY